MTEHILTTAHNGSTVSAAVGDVVALHLSERPTTGYRWHFDVPAGLTVRDDDFAVGGSAPGAGGQRNLSLKAAKPGRYALSGALRRDPGSEATTSFAVTVEVA